MNVEVKKDPDEPTWFPCTFEGCGKQFQTLTALCTHEAVCSKASATPKVSCPTCGVKTGAHNLKKHMVLHQPAEHGCPACGKMFHFRYNLKVHIRKMHGKEGDPLGDGSAEGKNLELPPIPKTKSKNEHFECVLCGDVLKTRKTLRYHMNSHEGLTPYACGKEGCQKAFSHPQHRFHHEQVCRSGSTQKRCTLCGLELHVKGISRHMREVHLVIKEDRPVITESLYPCELCSAVLKSKKTLRCHMNTHKGVKPYPCRNAGCRESFSWRNQRNMHETQCRESGSECPVCGVELANGSLRQDHMAAFHKDGATPDDSNSEEKGQLKCPVCDKIFKKRSNFENHMNTHKAVKPYVCDKNGCRKGFSSKQSLAYHEKRCEMNGFERVEIKVEPRTEPF